MHTYTFYTVKTLVCKTVILLSVNLAGHGQLVKRLMTMELLSLNCVYIYILRLSLVYQINLNNNKQGNKKQYFFYNSTKSITICMGWSYTQANISRDITQFGKVYLGSISIYESPVARSVEW